MFDKIALGKLALSLCLTVLGVAAALPSARKETGHFNSDRVMLCSLLLGIRVALFLFIFALLKFDPQSDVTDYYVWATRVNQGHIPGESAETLPLHYGPLFLPLMGFLLKIWNDPKVFILGAILAELVLFITWLSFGGRIADVRVVKRAAILYIFCPLSIISTAIDGNNDVFAGMFVSLFVALMLCHRPALSGVVAGLSVVASKALTVVAGLPVFLAGERKPLWLLAAATPVVLVYGIWARFLSIDVVSGFQFHGLHYSSGNLPFWIGLFGPDLLTSRGRWLVNVLGPLLILAIAALPLGAHRSFRHKDVVPIMAAVTIAFMIVSAKSFPHYMLCALFPILLIVAEMDLRSGAVLYCLFSVLTSIESTWWFRGLNGDSPATIRETAAENWKSVLSFGAIETLLLATYGIMLWRCTEVYLKAIWARTRRRTMPV